MGATADCNYKKFSLVVLVAIFGLTTACATPPTYRESGARAASWEPE